MNQMVLILILSNDYMHDCGNMVKMHGKCKIDDNTLLNRLYR